MVVLSSIILHTDTDEMDNTTTNDKLTTADHHPLVELATRNLRRGDMTADTGQVSEVPKTRGVAMVNVKNK